MKQTGWRKTETGTAFRAEYGFRKTNHEYFAITGEEYALRKDGQPGGREPIACGCMHEEVSRTFPELAPFIRWHLADVEDGLPMHYMANGVFWFEILAGLRNRNKHHPDPEGAFRSTIALGAVDSDEAEWAAIKEILAGDHDRGLVEAHGIDPDELGDGWWIVRLRQKAALRRCSTWLSGRQDALGRAFREDMEKLAALDLSEDRL